jgi:hypothetical protein
MRDIDPLQELGRALSFSPSPEFAARVRHHIVSAPTQPARWSLYGLAAAAALVIAASATMARVGWQSPVLEVPPAPDMVMAPAIAAPAPAIAAPALVHARATRAVEPPAPFAEVLVPDDQRLALERLMGSIRAGRATVPELIVDDVVDDDGRRMPRALVIEPLRLQRLPGTPGEPIKEPIK